MTIAIKPTATTATIEHNDSTILTVDSSGNITPSNQMYPKVPAFRVLKLTTDQTGVSANTNTKITFNTEDYDTGGDLDLTNNKFVAPIDGYYHFTASTHMQGPNGQYQLQLWRNGSLKAYGSIAYSSGTNVSPNLSHVVYLDADDYVEVYGRSSTATTFYSGSALTWWTGHLVSV